MAGDDDRPWAKDAEDKCWKILMLHRNANAYATYPHTKDVCVECGQAHPCDTVKIIKGVK